MAAPVTVRVFSTGHIYMNVTRIGSGSWIDSRARDMQTCTSYF